MGTAFCIDNLIRRPSNILKCKFRLLFKRKKKTLPPSQMLTFILNFGSVFVYLIKKATA